MERDDSHMKVEAEVGVMWAPAKEPQGPLESGRDKKGPSPRGFGGSMALPTP